jgi:lysyl-tRNA synthetase class 2
MKPENRAAGELTSNEVTSNKAVELTEDEKAVLKLLKANSPIDLNELKGQTGLSNKKWDKAIKGLTKNKLARVEKTEEGLLVSLL